MSESIIDRLNAEFWAANIVTQAFVGQISPVIVAGQNEAGAWLHIGRENGILFVAEGKFKPGGTENQAVIETTDGKVAVFLAPVNDTPEIVDLGEFTGEFAAARENSATKHGQGWLIEQVKAHSADKPRKG